MKLSGARIVCESLLKEGVKDIFGFPGGVVIPLYHVLPEYSIRHILVRHEQGAAHAADGYARATGDVGVCLVTSGPGATNIVTGLATAQMDSVPMVALTGQVPTSHVGTDYFQETDITGISLPITKHNWLVEDVKDLARILKEAFHIARTGRPGPVLVDLPRDVLVTETEFEYPERVNLPGYRPTMFGHIRQIRAAAAMINEAKRPLILAGHGVIISRAYEELLGLAERAQLPVITTLLGISGFPESHRLSFGMAGMHGTVYANKAICECDVLIAIGMRFDDRLTGRLSAFAPNARVIHIDIDPAEIGKNVRVHVPVVGDVKNVLRELNKLVEEREESDWVRQIEQWREEHPAARIRETDKLLPQHVVRRIYEATRGQAIVVADVGQNQMFAAQHYWYDEPNTYITSGGLGTMGYGLPAAMGAAVARPEKTVWCVVGDGGLQMTLQEMATLVQEEIPLKIAVLNNRYLGMIRQWQQLFYHGRYSHARLHGPDFVKLADAYGMAGYRAATPGEALPAIAAAMEHRGPALVEFMVEEEENVFPMVPPGACLTEVIEER